MGEHTSLVRNTSFKNSKKMKNAVFCKANSEEYGRNSNYVDPNIKNSHVEAPNDLPNVSSVLDCHGPALPVITQIWRGSFKIWNKDNGILDEFVAHMSSKACQKVFEEFFTWKCFPSLVCGQRVLRRHPPAMIELPSISFCQIQDCSKDMDVNRCINTVKTKDWDARSSLSPLSNKD